ncbi:unnamed protein product [Spirodela intermedia]|uniref:Peptide N-acetyl-beta-D-glucosaminyl asparaginase amidase A N-terminal domain-containing protein n=1 Tax=Spirodela intermedia TaxID=51605 RepID=A0A7I8L873_SPIIN|nr:unnamed protein product [Spirodela intermedia]
MYSRRSFSALLPFSLLLLLLCLGGRCCPQASAGRLDLEDDLTDPELEEEEGLEYMDPTPPQAFPNAEETPSCSVKLLQHDFAHTVGAPPVAVNYTLPENCKWNRAVLEFAAACEGEQNDRIAAVWLDGVEILRTSTAKPTTQVGVFWRVRKDVTHFAAMLVPVASSARTLTVMLENSLDDYFKGIYHVNVTIDFYGRGLSEPRTGKLGFLRLPSSRGEDEEEQQASGFVPVPPRYGGEGGEAAQPAALGLPTEETKLRSLLERPADMIIPVANKKKGADSGFWFRIDRETEIRGSRLRIPRNAYKAVLEVCVSYHGDDEFWYANPPDSYNIQNNIPSRRGNWAFRELVATVDGLYAGSVLPFPVVFPGGINPFFWTPVVAIKAFDLPTYDLDLTPFLGQLLNGRPHTIGLKVSHAISFWLVNANLHLWLDPHLPAVPAMMVKHHAAPTFLSRNANNKFLEGHFQLEAARQARFEGWARSSLGNFTTLIDSHFKYKSSVEYKMQGTLKEVFSQSKYTADVRITEQPNRFLARVINQARYPVKMLTSTASYAGDRMLSQANVSHMLYQFTDVTMNQMRSQNSITDMQVAGGWLQVNGAALSGSATTLQTYQRRDNGRCHTRKVGTQDRGITVDQTNTDCNTMIPDLSTVPE